MENIQNYYNQSMKEVYKVIIILNPYLKRFLKIFYKIIVMQHCELPTHIPIPPQSLITRPTKSQTLH